MYGTEAAQVSATYLAGFVVVVFSFAIIVLFGGVKRRFISDTKLQQEDGKRENYS